MSKYKYLITIVVLGTGSAVFAWHPTPIQFEQFKGADFAGQLTPLFLLALLIERSLEVFISTWRGGGEVKLQAAVDRCKKALDADANNANKLTDLHLAEDKLAEFKSSTQQIAMPVALVFGNRTIEVGAYERGNINRGVAMTIRSIWGGSDYGLRYKRKSREESQFPRSKFPRRRWRVAVLVAIMLAMVATSSCADLTQISQFAKASRDVGTTFSTIADRGESSCALANSFISEKYNPIPALDCHFYTTVKAPLLKINLALFNYISALGNLATDDLSKVGGGWDSIPSEIKLAEPTISSADQAKASAASGLAKAITNLWANGYRQRELSKLIGDHNKDVQEVTQFLSAYAADKYLKGLDDDERTEKSYCDGIAAPGTEPLATDLLRLKCAADESRLEQQKKAVQQFQKALVTIAEAHQKLYDERQHWDAKQLSKDLGPQTVSLASAAISINHAF